MNFWEGILVLALTNIVVFATAFQLGRARGHAEQYCADCEARAREEAKRVA